MDELLFEIQGSEIEPYQIRIVRRDNRSVSAYCTCQAAGNGMHCKHRVGLLTGKPEGVIGKREADIETVVSWVKGSEVEMILSELQQAASQIELLKSRISELKKLLAKAMLD